MTVFWTGVTVISAGWLGVQTVVWWLLMRAGWVTVNIQGSLTACALFYPLGVTILLFNGIFNTREMIPSRMVMGVLGTGWLLLLSILGYRIARRMKS